MKIEKEISFVNFQFSIEIEMPKNPFSISILNWKLNGTFGARIGIRPCINRSFDFQLNFVVENWILTLFLIKFNFQSIIKNSLWNFNSMENPMNVLYTDGESVYQKYNSFFDLKKNEFWKFFIFHLSIKKQKLKMKEFVKIHFLISNQKINSNILILVFWNWF